MNSAVDTYILWHSQL